MRRRTQTIPIGLVYEMFVANTARTKECYVHLD